MSQHYSDPSRESDEHALPDVEVFYIGDNEIEFPAGRDEPGEYLEAGWYWQSCSPGCLPDSEPSGPFATRAEAVADAQDTE